ncbi:NADH-quinone oxidoreductase subunit NuoH [Photobacterium phosphoreum]|uniref:NADH-quinone oxidoreductase subunit NuoH n=1 Tax=Photobacterium phosphoreum TaxID=659 RepID=UPI0005D3DFF8|nr:NADH-quinone oxidoreductase subunit NuoH [Photobacterium phosphoreum]KJF87173.1 NADH:ubiquinone oxidoreductase [Photobacterium phosphoreum]PQJ85663.1 NADH-quinone oxidoreductase subunit H [Photobacterium phosphoreum]PSV71468.1 NADH-quinone oxidoreductase subunit NuoH [Photobacterium phosphoreum]
MSEFSYWILMIIGMIVTILGLILVAGYTVLFERRCLALLQDRYGPNRAGPLGLFQAIFDALKLLTKEYFLPGFVDKRLYILAPLLVVVAILVSFALLPIGQGISWAANLNIGLLFLLGLSSIHAYGVFLGGWASNSKYTMLGAIRTIAQLISYELAMGIAVLGVVMLAGSFSLSTIVDNQTIPYIFLQPIGFIVFFIAGIAETHRLPFDMPEAENELNAGFNTEYGGMPFAMFFLGEYLGVILVGAMTTTLYLGGWHGPGAETYPLLGVGWFVLKTFLLVFFFVWMRASVPRTRYDQLMVFGWKYLLPIGLVNILLTAIVGAFLM